MIFSILVGKKDLPITPMLRISTSPNQALGIVMNNFEFTSYSPMNTILKCICYAVVCGMIPASRVQAEFVTFEFSVPGATNQAGVALDGSSLSFTDVAVPNLGPFFTVRVTGTVTSEIDAEFNLNGQDSGNSTTDFGINSSNDSVTDAFDSGESASFSFTTSAPATIQLVSIDFDRLAATDSGRLGLDNGNTIMFTGANSSGILQVNQTITQTISLAEVSGNGFGLEAITLHISPTAVPEPTSLLLFGSVVTPFALRRKRRRL